MAKEREALKLAQKALSNKNAPAKTIYEALAAIQKALAQPEQEPVALPCCGYTDASAIKWNPCNQVVQCHNCGQVYTTPPQRTWVGLTDEDFIGLTTQQIFAMKFAEANLKERNA